MVPELFSDFLRFSLDDSIKIMQSQHVMNSLDYILSNANLPFDLGSLEPEADTLFAAVPKAIWEPFNRAEDHSETVLAGDAVSAWIEKNWRNVLPILAARFNR